VKWKLDYLPREKWRYLANFERVQFAAIRSSTAGREFEKPGSEWFEVPEA
jgi:hypothetical protein